MLTPRDKNTLLEAAVAAPSADNSQPWLYRWMGDALDLWIDARRAGKPSDARYVLSDLGLGACIENLCIQARALGYTDKVQYLPDEEQDPLWVARLEFSPSNKEPPDTALAQAIPRRCTDRRFPWKGPVEEALRQALAAEASQLPGARLVWLDPGSQQRHAVLKALQTAESLRFQSRRLHHELFSSICFSAGRKGACPEGLSPRSLGIEAPVWPFFKALRHWPLMRAFNAIGGARLMGLRSAVLPVRLSPGLALLCIEGEDRPAILAAGRALERVWLRATAAGLSIQPYAAPGVLGLGFVEVEARFQDRLGLIRQALEQACSGGCGLLLLRMGRAAGLNKNRGARRPLSSFEWRGGE
ncbi:MAG TPA: hypothetical protein ENI99_01155 [Sedimenticola sp.]|nr:hypothetical protein [Sedimenticola sp.]